MSFPAATFGILAPEDLAVIRNVYGRIVSEPWVSKDPTAREQFAKFVINMYERGMCHPEKLFRLCLVAAGHKLAVIPSMAHGAEQKPSNGLQR